MQKCWRVRQHQVTWWHNKQNFWTSCCIIPQILYNWSTSTESFKWGRKPKGCEVCMNTETWFCFVRDVYGYKICILAIPTKLCSFMMTKFVSMTLLTKMWIPHEYKFCIHDRRPEFCSLMSTPTSLIVILLHAWKQMDQRRHIQFCNSCILLPNSIFNWFWVKLTSIIESIVKSKTHFWLMNNPDQKNLFVSHLDVLRNGTRSHLMQLTKVYWKGITGLVMITKTKLVSMTIIVQNMNSNPFVMIWTRNSAKSEQFRNKKQKKNIIEKKIVSHFDFLMDGNIWST